jgi:endonuclease YncB( thermonuclease family)
MRTILFITLIIKLTTAAAAQSILTGTVTNVRDGDTIEVGNPGRQVRHHEQGPF